jgi:hypothetical protein
VAGGRAQRAPSLGTSGGSPGLDRQPPEVTVLIQFVRMTAEDDLSFGELYVS